MANQTDPETIRLGIFAKVASEYHDGQNSMLYAVASTGELRPGRPGVDLRDLAWRLEKEVTEALDLATENCEWTDATDLAAMLCEVQEWRDNHPEVGK